MRLCEVILHQGEVGLSSAAVIIQIHILPVGTNGRASIVGVKWTRPMAGRNEFCGGLLNNNERYFRDEGEHR